MLPLLLLALFQTQNPGTESPSTGSPRDFDFWAGEWVVQNRHLNAGGVWNDGTQTRARITPVIDGGAMLEEWAGPFGNGFMNGFSLRSYDPSQDLWTIILFWTMDGNSAFGKMQGRFRHGRGEFLAPLHPTPGQGQVTRYTFSDGLSQTVRWDQANSSDGGLSWKTDWIMEFTRTAPAVNASESALSAKPWNAGTLSLQLDARQLDWLRGSWTGKETRSGFKGAREAKLDCTLLNKDCLVLTQSASRNLGEKAWDKELQIRGYVAGKQRWESWRVSEEDTVLRSSIGTKTGNGFTFSSTLANGSVRRESLERVDQNNMLWTLSIKETPEAEERLVWVRDLQRDV